MDILSKKEREHREKILKDYEKIMERVSNTLDLIETRFREKKAQDGYLSVYASSVHMIKEDLEKLKLVCAEAWDKYLPLDSDKDFNHQ